MKNIECEITGTTAVAAKQLGRNFVGFEISKEYCDIANKRLEQKQLNEALNDTPNTKLQS